MSHFLRRPCRFLLLFSMVLLTAVAPALIASALSTAEAAPQLELVPQTGHSDEVTTLAFSPDGKVLATGCREGTIKLWETQTGVLLRTLFERSGAVRNVTFSPDGTTLASTGGNDLSINLWHPGTGALLHRIEGSTSPVGTFAFSPDGTLLVSGDIGGWTRLWRVADRKMLRTLGRNQRGVLSVRSVAFSPDGATVVAGNGDGTILFSDVATGKPQRVVSGHPGGVWATVFSPDGKTVASRGSDGMIRLWDVHSGEPQREIPTGSVHARTLAFVNNGTGLVAGLGVELMLWDAVTGARRQSAVNPDGYMSNIAVAPDGVTVASGNQRGSVTLWHAAGPLVRRVIEGRTTQTRTLAYSPDGQILVSGHGDRTIRLWDVRHGELIRTLTRHTAPVTAVTFPVGGKLFASAGMDGLIVLWDIQTGRVQRLLTGYALGPICSLAFAPNGQTLISGHSNGSIGLWRTESGELARSLRGHDAPVYAVGFAPDGQTMASGGGDKTVKLWDTGSGRLQRTLTGHTGRITALCFSPDGTALASAGATDGTVRIWDIATGSTRHILGPHQGGALALAFSAIGQVLASGGGDGSIKLWDIAGGREIQTIMGRGTATLSLAYAPDNRLLLSGDADNTISMWSLRTRRLRATLLPLDSPFLPLNHPMLPALRQPDTFPGADTNEYSYMVVTPEGYYSGSAGSDRNIRLRVDGKLFPAESFGQKLRRPELVWQALADRELPEVGTSTPGTTARSTQQSQLLPPHVEFVTPADGSRVAASIVAATIETRSTHPITDLVVLVNGSRLTTKAITADGKPISADGKAITADSKPISADSKPISADSKPISADSKPISADSKPISADSKPISADSKPISADSKPISADGKPISADGKGVFGLPVLVQRFLAGVPLPAVGATIRLQAIATDDQGLQSPRCEIMLLREEPAPVVGRLLGLSVGVGRYRDTRLNLKWAGADALEITAAFNRLDKTQPTLYKSVQIDALINEQATSRGVLSALDRLISQATAHDTVVIFLGGHGWRSGDGSFFFATHEVDTTNIAGTALKWSEVVHHLTVLSEKSRRVLILLDACHSGSATTNEELVKALLNANAGVMILASSRGTEVSLEMRDQGHGAFTRALLEVVRGEAVLADNQQLQDVTLWDLAAYVRQRVRHITEGLQNPQVPFLQDFDTDSLLLKGAR